MSSNHTLVSRQKWEAQKERIARGEAYIITRKEELARIERLIEERKKELEAIRRANEEVIQQSIDALKEKFEQNVNSISGTVVTQLSIQADAFGKNIQEMHNELADASVQLSAFDHKIESLATNYNAVFQEIANREDSAKSRAELIAKEVESLLTLIRELEPERFLPEEYARISALYNSIQCNLQNGDYQAAITVSQNGVIGATTLLARLQLINEQYNTQADVIRENAVGIQRRIENLSSKEGVLCVEIDDEKEEYEYDISYWSNGSFDDIVTVFQRLQNVLGSKLTLEQLNQLGEELDEIDEAITRCDNAARSERAGAIIAADMAIRINDNLSAEGWNLLDSGYDSDDYKKPFTMKFEDPNGNIASIVVAPETPTTPGIFMEVFSEDQALAELTKDGIHALLESNGITIDNRDERDDCHLNPDPETFIANAVAEASQIIGQQQTLN